MHVLWSRAVWNTVWNGVWNVYGVLCPRPHNSNPSTQFRRAATCTMTDRRFDMLCFI